MTVADIKNKSNDVIETTEHSLETPKKSNVHIRHFGYIRTLGLALVLLYHFFPKALPGGFIGVDIFFVFSGYLITALALEEYRLTQTFNLKTFAERRFFRIFPTVAFAILIVLPLTLLGNDDLRYNLSNQVFAGLGFISNLYEASTGISYATNFAPHLFVHLWSLALEVQFYLVWGLLIFWLSKRFKKALSIFIFLIAFVLFAVSSLSMFIGSLMTTTYSGLYYSPMTHVFPFFLGAMLASLAGIKTTPLLRNLSSKFSIKQLINRSVIAAVVLILGALILHFDSKFTYLFGFTIASIVTLLLILYLRLLHDKTTSQEPRVIKYIADVSYGVYIFHWAFLIIFLNFKVPHILAVLLTLIASFLCATIMFYGIDPMLKGRKSFLSAFLSDERFATVLVYAKPIIPTFLVLLSLIALAKTSAQTTLSKTLWTGSNQQGIQQLTLGEHAIKTGTAGADTLIIGDSVTMGTTVAFDGAPQVQNLIPTAYVDAAGDRTISEAYQDNLKSDLKMLPDNATIVFALGTNSVDATKDMSHIDDLINTYASKRKIVLVTPANWGAGGPFNSDKTADYELTLKGKYPNVKIADWRGLSQGHTDWFDVDGIHIADRIEGRKAWINLVKETIAEK